MIETTINAVELLERAETRLISNVDRLEDVNAELNEKQVECIEQNLERLEEQLKIFKFTHCLELLKDIRLKLHLKASLYPPYSFAAFQKDAYGLNKSIFIELNQIVFGFIPSDKAKYFQNDKLFGDDVFDSFPSARDEIKEAGNCFAMNLNTACVFYLMRAAEIAVKAMYLLMTGRKNLVYGKDKITAKPLSKPIELCDWNTLITGLKLALDQLEKGKSKSRAKHKTYSFYSEAIGIFTSIKDGWRNTISHGHEVNHDKERKLFKSGETDDIMRDTERFMRRIATKIKE